MGYNCREQCEDSASLPHFSPSSCRPTAEMRLHRCPPALRALLFSTRPRVLRNFVGTPSPSVVVEVGPTLYAPHVYVWKGGREACERRRRRRPPLDDRRPK